MIIRMKDEARILDEMNVSIHQDGSSEYCYFGLFEIDESNCLVTVDMVNGMDYGVQCDKKEVIIPRELALGLLKLCSASNNGLLMLHNHPDELCLDNFVSFSQEDIEYAESLNRVKQALGYNIPLLFVVVNSVSMEAHYYTDVMERVTIVLNSQNDKGGRSHV